MSVSPFTNQWCQSLWVTGTCPQYLDWGHVTNTPSFSEVILVLNIYEIYLHSVNCTKFDQSILRKITKIVATRCQILALKCNEFNFSWSSAPDPVRWTYSAPPGPIAGFQGPTSNGMEGKRRKGRGKGKKRGEFATVCPPTVQRDQRLRGHQPISAFLMAGVSLTPSPVTATTLPCRWQASTISSFWWGIVRAKTMSWWFRITSSSCMNVMSARSAPCTTIADASLNTRETS